MRALCRSVSQVVTQAVRVVPVLDLTWHGQELIALLELLQAQEAVDVVIVFLDRFFQSFDGWQSCAIVIYGLTWSPTNELNHLDWLKIVLLANNNDPHAHFVNGGLLLQVKEGPHIVAEEVKEWHDSHWFHFGFSVQHIGSDVINAGEGAHPGINTVEKV
jgi:hypothetical protein